MKESQTKTTVPNRSDKGTLKKHSPDDVRRVGTPKQPGLVKHSPAQVSRTTKDRA